MQLVADFEDDQTVNSRAAAIRLALFTLRLMENWRRVTGSDDRTLLLAAIAAISLERLTRIPLEGAMRNIFEEFSEEHFGKCSVSSIASATGFSRETTRRKLQGLVDEGLVMRSDRGSFNVTPDMIRRSEWMEVVRAQFQLAARLTNELVKDGLLINGNNKAAS